jgi:hypothetical protein
MSRWPTSSRSCSTACHGSDTAAQLAWLGGGLLMIAVAINALH